MSVILPNYEKNSNYRALSYADNFHEWEVISIVSNNGKYGIYSLTKQKEIFPVEASSIKINYSFRKTLGKEKYIVNIGLITIFDSNGKRYKYDFTSDFEEIAKSYAGSRIVYCSRNGNDFDVNNPWKHYVKILRTYDGHYVMSDDNGLVENIGTFDSYKEIDANEDFNNEGYLLVKKKGKQAYFSIFYSELMTNFNKKVSIPQKVNLGDCNETDFVSIISDGKLYGIYSYNSRRVIVSIRFKDINIRKYGKWTVFYMNDKLGRRYIYYYKKYFYLK